MYNKYIIIINNYIQHKISLCRRSNNNNNNDNSTTKSLKTKNGWIFLSFPHFLDLSQRFFERRRTMYLTVNRKPTFS